MRTHSNQPKLSSARKGLIYVALFGLFLPFLPGITSGRNAIIFVADGLRQGSVNEEDAPTMSLVRKQGVFFANSHSLFPTFTTPNASALATGHYLGDTGDFSNTVYTGYPLSMLGETQTPFLENNRVLANINEHFGGNYLHEETLLAYAAAHGFNTAAIGKLGPTLIQDAGEAKLVNGFIPVPKTVIIDDSTGKPGGVPLDPRVAQALVDAHLQAVAPDRSNRAAPTSEQNNGFPGTNSSSGTLAANIVQQQYFADALSKAVLPMFQKDGKPFVVVFWSRDPDGTQRRQS
jgi:Type I phosphodiesterase / nucleotide pyrophosphatase